MLDVSIDFDRLQTLIQGRGYKVEPVHADGVESRMIGVNLKGPRGNKHFLFCENGNFRESEAVLWCDGVDYATRNVQSKQTNRRR